MNEILKDEQFLPTAKDLISKARKSIYVSSFKVEITSKRRGEKLKKLFDLLIEKAGNGVDVRLLTNKRDNRGYVPDSNAYAARFFQVTKVKVRCLPNARICHAKLLIIDNETAVCGSHNLSVKSCHNNFELSCLLTEEQPVLLLASAYEAVWDTAKAILP